MSPPIEMGFVGLGLSSRTLLALLFVLASTAAEGAVPLGLPEPPSKYRNISSERAALGKDLFFDRRLSRDGTVSCATCHMPDRNLTDGRVVARGIGQQMGTRNVVSLNNVVYNATLFWDGRSAELESQALLPLLNSREHGLISEDQLNSILEGIPAYRKKFGRAFGVTRITSRIVMVAMATYERTLLAGNSSFDRYFFGGDHNAMDKSAIRGLELFKGRAGCAECHTIGDTSALFTDQRFHASPGGLPDSANSSLVELTQLVTDLRKRSDADELNAVISSNSNIAALGRFVATGVPSDIGLFRTPSLRNVAATAPYLHDGSVLTLEGVVEAELYTRNDRVRAPIVATAEEKSDLLAFLKALSSPQHDLNPSDR